MCMSGAITNKCNVCGERKPLSEFYWNDFYKRHEYDCKECRSERSRKYYRENKDRVRRRDLYRRHGITHEEYVKMWEYQHGCCAICGVDFKEEKSVIDHDHETGEVRGLLCNGCNRGIGFFMDNPQSLERAIEYLR